MRQLNNEITAQRNVRFFAFALVKADDVDFQNSRKEQFLFLQKLGFEVVEFKEVDSDTILSAVEEFENKVAGYSVPSDGLVLIYDDIAYGLSWDGQLNSPGIPSRLSGRMKRQKPRCVR